MCDTIGKVISPDYAIFGKKRHVSPIYKYFWGKKNDVFEKDMKK